VSLRHALDAERLDEREDKFVLEWEERWKANEGRVNSPSFVASTASVAKPVRVATSVSRRWSQPRRHCPEVKSPPDYADEGVSQRIENDIVDARK
jgi:hypothetical protein